MNRRRWLIPVICLVLTAPASAERKAMEQGPIRITAEETESKETGRYVEARGNVHVDYELDTGDTIHSISKFARYDQKEEFGELWGNPKAVWKRKDATQPDTALSAEKISLRVKGSELFASGNVEAVQSGRTLKAQEIRYYGVERKMVAETGRPAFFVQEPEHRVQISAENIVGWMDKREIQFSRKVKGRVEFSRKKP